MTALGRLAGAAAVVAQAGMPAAATRRQMEAVPAASEVGAATAAVVVVPQGHALSGKSVGGLRFLAGLFWSRAWGCLLLDA